MSPDGRACEDSSMPDSRQGPTWEFDELSHAGHEHLDATYVAGYDQKYTDRLERRCRRTSSAGNRGV